MLYSHFPDRVSRAGEESRQASDRVKQGKGELIAEIPRARQHSGFKLGSINFRKSRSLFYAITRQVSQKQCFEFSIWNHIGGESSCQCNVFIFIFFSPWITLYPLEFPPLIFYNFPLFSNFQLSIINIFIIKKIIKLRITR